MLWAQKVALLAAEGRPFVLASVISARGSTPRDEDSKMVITAEAIYDSVGGGTLEFAVTSLAREMLQENVHAKSVHEFPLGPDLGQCCGGYISVLLEPFVQQSLNIVLFGGGHVAQALMKILDQMPYHVHWTDSREQFEMVDGWVRPKYQARPEAVAEAAQSGTLFLIMTHDHALDYRLCETILRRHQNAYCGLIGSRGKAKKFRKRLQQAGLEQTQIERLRCPIGRADIVGKRPMEIAVSIAAELMDLAAVVTPAGADSGSIRRSTVLKLAHGNNSQ